MTAPTRNSLSREIIAKAALALTDEHGLAGLSMRKLGTQLGVEAMSLYHYVDSKDDLLDAVLDQLFDEIELPWELPAGDWEGAVRLGLASFREVLVRHQAALELFASRPAHSPRAIEVLAWAYNRFLEVGLSVEQAHHALHFAVAFVMGHTASSAGTLAVLHGDVTVDLDGVAPETADLIRAGQDITVEELFEAGLNAVVAGLRAAYQLG